MFSGKGAEHKAKEIWLVDPAPAVIDKLETAVSKLDKFMVSQGLNSAPEQVANLKGDEARGQFVNLFKEVQRLKTQLDQYTDLTPENTDTIEKVIAPERLQAFRGVYLDTAQRLKAQQDKGGTDTSEHTQQLDFEFVLFASAIIDYDYIMSLITRYAQSTPGKQKMTREELIGLIASDAKFIDDHEDIAAYISSLTIGGSLSEKDIRQGYEDFKNKKSANQMAELAQKHELDTAVLQSFVDKIMERMIFDGEALSDLLAPLDLGWKARTKKELALMEDLIPLLHKLAQGHEISGLGAYE